MKTIFLIIFFINLYAESDAFWEIGMGSASKIEVGDDLVKLYSGKTLELVSQIISSKCNYQKLGEEIESYLKLVNGVYNILPRNNNKIKIILFPNKKFFDKYLLKISLPEMARDACYVPGLNVTLVTLSNINNQLFLSRETIQHEITHNINANVLGNLALSPWFDEGMACYFQYWDVRKNGKENFTGNWKRAKSGIYGYFPEEAIRSIKFDKNSIVDIMRKDFKKYHIEENEVTNYSVSWLLINFLTSSPDGKKFLELIIDDFRKGKNDDTLIMDNAVMERFKLKLVDFIKDK